MTSVTVLTPSLGYGRFIGDALDSVRGQDGADVDHVVQDGGSTDETLRVLATPGRTAQWVSEPDGGQSDALNRALRRASGTWVAWLNADEFYLPGALATLAHEGDRSAADVVYGDAIFVDEDGRLLRLLPQHSFNAGTLRRYGPFIASCAALFRLSSLPESPWNPILSRAMDWDLYLSLHAHGGRFVHVPQPCGAFRVHQAQVTAQVVTRDHPDVTFLRGRYGVGVGMGRRLAGLDHVLRKASSGAYRREVRARAFRGADMRWFASTQARTDVDALLDHVSAFARAR